MVHFDAFDAFSADALVHFGSGIQLQGGEGGVRPLVKFSNFLFETFTKLYQFSDVKYY